MEQKKIEKLPTDENGMLLNPGEPELCLGSGIARSIECKCDECDYLGECFPEFLNAT